MKLTSAQLGELKYYLDEMRPDTDLSFRKENSEILEFGEHDLILYVAKVNVMRDNPDDPEKPNINKEPVFFLETHRAPVRQTTNFSDVCLAAIIFLAAEDIRMAFDLVRQDFLSTHPEQTPERLQ